MALLYHAFAYFLQKTKIVYKFDCRYLFASFGVFGQGIPKTCGSYCGKLLEKAKNSVIYPSIKVLKRSFWGESNAFLHLTPPVFALRLDAAIFAPLISQKHAVRQVKTANSACQKSLPSFFFAQGLRLDAAPRKLFDLIKRKDTEIVGIECAGDVHGYLCLVILAAAEECERFEDRAVA